MFWEDQGSVPFSHINLATVSKMVKSTSSKKCLYILIEKHRLTQKANKPCEHNQTTSLWYKTQDVGVGSGEDLKKEGRGVPYGLSCGAAKLVNIDVLLSSAVFGGIRNTFPLRQKLMGGKEAGYRIDQGWAEKRIFQPKAQFNYSTFLKTNVHWTIQFRL